MALVMYDLDGTLLDTAGEIAEAVNMTLEDFGHETVSDQQVRDWIGHGTGWLMKTAWQHTQGPMDAPWDKVMERFVTHYEKTAGTHSRAFPHVLDTLSRTRAAGAAELGSTAGSVGLEDSPRDAAPSPPASKHATTTAPSAATWAADLRRITPISSAACSMNNGSVARRATGAGTGVS